MQPKKWQPFEEAQAKIETKSPVQAGVVNWENLKDEYLARKAKEIIDSFRSIEEPQSQKVD